MIRVCLDNNILISAFLFPGKPAQIFDMAVEGKITVVVSPAILAEVAGVFKNKFKRDQQYIKGQLKVISDVCWLTMAKMKVSALKHDPDNRILEIAVFGQVDFIVTGDKKHLLPLQDFQGIPIVTASQFLKDYLPS